MRMDQIKGAAGDMSNSMASPLKHFTNAKKKINGIFVDISGYIDEFGEFVDDIGNSEENMIINEEIEQDIYLSQEKIDGIKDILARDHMKVVFFGRTSNGKSTVINAMLRDKILPSGIGHTTNCFLSVAGTNEGNGTEDNSGAYLLCDGSDKRMSIDSVSQLGHALSNESLASDSLIQLFWPKSKCALLKDEVVFVDSPGIDVTSDLDRWIDKYCRDADVFVLVANAESTLMLAEKNFFHRVNEKLSKPNIFILNNRWDASASEPESMEQVRQQHLERGISFLSDELKVVTKQQAKDRVFFVSAKEALQSRIPRTALSPGSATMAEGHQARMIEFAQFEREFEECISKSATRTKFDYHVQRAVKIVDTLYSRAEWVHTKACELLTECKERRSSVEDRLLYIDNQLQHVIAGSKSGITQLAAEAEHQVRSAMTDEIKRLTLLVDEFKRPFHPNPMVLRVYKAELYRHVEDGLGRNLSARCSAALQKRIDKNRGDMIEAIGPLITTSPVKESDSTCVDGSSTSAAKHFKGLRLPSFPSLRRSASTQPIFDMSYDIDCASLCADFQEDIDFRFSLGFSQLMARFIGPKEARRVRLGGITADQLRVSPPVPVAHPHIPEDHQGPYSPPQPVVPEDLIWNLFAGYFRLTQSHSAIFIVGVGMVPYFFYRSIGWKAIAFSAAGYCALYGYERLTWTSRAKEKALKRQFVKHATDKLNLVISFTSSNCSHQVQQELSATFAQLCTDADQVREILKTESDDLLAQSKHLQKTLTRSKTLRNKAGWLASELDSFSKTFLAAPPIYNNGNA